MGPMLLSRYARDGTEKARRQMLAMCQSDPDVLPEVLGHFVNMVADLPLEESGDNESGDDSDYDEASEILDDIQEILSLARRQGVLPPVRIARILAGEGTSQFGSSGESNNEPQQRTVPLSVALDYVGAILDDSRREIGRLKSEVEEYNQLCNSMEKEVDRFLEHPKRYLLRKVTKRLRESMWKKCIQKYEWQRMRQKNQKARPIFLEKPFGERWIKAKIAFSLFLDSLQKESFNKFRLLIE